MHLVSLIVSLISDQNWGRISHFPHVSYVPHAFILPDLNTLIISYKPVFLNLCETAAQ